MEDNVIIKVVGIQAASNDGEAIELQTTGKWYHKNGKEYLIYIDHQLNEDIATKTRVTFDGSSVSVIRSGGTNTHLLFETDVSHIIPYETDFGLLEMVSSTKSIKTNVDQNSLDLRVTYHLSLNNSDMGLNIFHITAHRQ